MNPDKQRIKIAEVCGYVPFDAGLGITLWQTPKGIPFKICLRNDLPDYLNDLNAMRLAESIEGLDADEYIEALQNVCGYEYPIFATAKQRAESFLLALDLWED